MKRCAELSDLQSDFYKNSFRTFALSTVNFIVNSLPRTVTLLFILLSIARLSQAWATGDTDAPANGKKPRQTAAQKLTEYTIRAGEIEEIDVNIHNLNIEIHTLEDEKAKVENKLKTLQKEAQEITVSTEDSFKKLFLGTTTNQERARNFIKQIESKILNQIQTQLDTTIEKRNQQIQYKNQLHPETIHSTQKQALQDQAERTVIYANRVQNAAQRAQEKNRSHVAQQGDAARENSKKTAQLAAGTSNPASPLEDVSVTPEYATPSDGHTVTSTPITNEIHRYTLSDPIVVHQPNREISSAPSDATDHSQTTETTALKKPEQHDGARKVDVNENAAESDGTATIRSNHSAPPTPREHDGNCNVGSPPISQNVDHLNHLIDPITKAVLKDLDLSLSSDDASYTSLSPPLADVREKLYRVVKAWVETLEKTNHPLYGHALEYLHSLDSSRYEELKVYKAYENLVSHLYPTQKGRVDGLVKAIQNYQQTLSSQEKPLEKPKQQAISYSEVAREYGEKIHPESNLKPHVDLYVQKAQEYSITFQNANEAEIQRAHQELLNSYATLLDQFKQAFFRGFQLFLSLALDSQLYEFTNYFTSSYLAKQVID